MSLVPVCVVAFFVFLSAVVHLRAACAEPPEAQADVVSAAAADDDEAWTKAPKAQLAFTFATVADVSRGGPSAAATLYEARFGAVFRPANGADEEAPADEAAPPAPDEEAPSAPDEGAPRALV